MPVRIATPLYPHRAKNLLVEGWAMVNFSVDRRGNVVPSSIEIVDSDPPGFFERSSITAARTFEFENNSGFLLNDVSYVFRYELEELRSSRSGLRAPPPLVREAVPRRFITPAYPDAAASQGIGGYVVVEFSISTTGEVSAIEITESQPAGVFDQAALNAARRLFFEPRLIDGEPVAVDNIQYRFDWNPDRLPGASGR